MSYQEIILLFQWTLRSISSNHVRSKGVLKRFYYVTHQGHFWMNYIYFLNHEIISEFDSIIAIILSNESIRPRTKLNNYLQLLQNEKITYWHHRNSYLENTIYFKSAEMTGNRNNRAYPSDWRFKKVLYPPSNKRHNGPHGNRYRNNHHWSCQ